MSLALHLVSKVVANGMYILTSLAPKMLAFIIFGEIFIIFGEITFLFKILKFGGTRLFSVILEIHLMYFNYIVVLKPTTNFNSIPLSSHTASGVHYNVIIKLGCL